MSTQGYEPSDIVHAPSRLTITRAQLVYVGWTMTLLAYVVVLNLWVEFNSAVVIDSFVISIFTAAVLLALLVLILGLERRVKSWFDTREGTIYRVVGTFSTLLILFLSKFVILEVIDIIFGEHVNLGRFIDVLVLVLLLIVAQRSMAWVWKRLGEPGSQTGDEVLAD
ncbi:MAG: hypothetical protein ACC726_13910 [Chloroflexota bacterium]